MCVIKFFKFCLFCFITEPVVYDITKDLKKISLSNHALKTPTSQCGASSFCTHIASGFGYLPMKTRFDPTNFTRDSAISLTAKLIPSELDVTNADLFRLSGELPGFQSRNETASNGVLQRTMSAFRLLGWDTFADNGHTSLQGRGLGVGIASGASYNDIHICFNGLHCVEFENKGAESSLLPALAQSAASATNFCIGLLTKGVALEDCIVPVIANTGMTICFGATIMLKKSFPTYVPLSKQLDLLDEHDCRVASAYLKKALEHAKALSALPRGLPIKVTEISLDCDAYFIKDYNDEVFNRGLGLFTDSGDRQDIQDGLDHMIRCLNRIYESDARDFAEYPLSVRTPVATEGNNFVIVFRDLCLLGYTVGTPNRVSQPDLYEAFKVALRSAMRLIHKAGVIHVDLYASNVMWRKESLSADGTEVVSIKVIDWDAAHCIDEHCFSPKIQRMISENVYKGKQVSFGTAHDELYLAVYDMALEVQHHEHWIDLASGDKSKLDKAFQILLQTYISSTM